MKFSSILALAAPVLAIIPEARLSRNEDASPKVRQSLPNLLKVESRQDVLDKWDLRDNLDLESGRFTVKRGPGSVWSKVPLASSKDEWTIDLVFRNSEQVDVDDHTYFDTNGLSFWLLDSGIPTDTSNFGGPKSFDGLQFLINNKGQRGLKIFANDQSKEIRNSVEDSLGGCTLNYLDSMVPFTLRVSYSSSQQYLKVQIDNNLCFKTDALSFANLKNDLTIGVSASVDPKSQEYWEILQLDVVDGLTTDAIDDHGVVEAGGVKIITVTQEDAKPTAQPASSLMERMARANQGASNNQAGNRQSDLDFKPHIKELEQKIENLAPLLDKIPELVSTLQAVKQNQEDQAQTISDLKARYEGFESLLASHYRELTEDSRLKNKNVMDAVLNQHSSTTQLINKMDSLMKNSREIHSQTSESRTQSSEFLSVIVKWVLIPLVIGITALIIVVYRLKKDIKHSKLL